MEKDNNQKDIFTNVSSHSNNSTNSTQGFISEGPASVSFDKMDKIFEAVDTSELSAKQPEIDSEVKKEEAPTEVITNVTDHKPKKNKGKIVVSFIIATIIAVVGGVIYHLSKKAVEGQLVTPLIRAEQNVDKETDEWLLAQQKSYMDAISVEQSAEEMQMDLDKDQTATDAIKELENYLYVTSEIMNLKDFETVIRTANVEGMTESIGLSNDLSTLIAIYNQHKNVDITDYSMAALEKNEAINKLAAIYRQCEDYFKSGKATECLTSAIYLACSSYCGDQLGLTPEEKATHTIEVVEAVEEDKNDEVYMAYGNQKVQLANTIVKQIANIEALEESIEQEGKDFALTKENLKTMTNALNTAKKIAFTFPGESCYEAKIQNGKKLVLRPDIATITTKAIEGMYN